MDGAGLESPFVAATRARARRRRARARVRRGDPPRLPRAQARRGRARGRGRAPVAGAGAPSSSSRGTAGILAGAALGASRCARPRCDRSRSGGRGVALLAVAALFHPAWFGLLSVADAALAGHSRSRRESALSVGPSRLRSSSGRSLPLREAHLDDRIAAVGRPPCVRRARPGRRPDPRVLAEPPLRRARRATRLSRATWPVTVGPRRPRAAARHRDDDRRAPARPRRQRGARRSSVFGAALLVPGWVPGDRAFALAAMLAYAPLVALVLSAVPASRRPGRPSRASCSEPASSPCCWPGTRPQLDRARRRDGPPAQAGRAAADSIRAVEREQDPARLVLFVQDATLRDAYAPLGRRGRRQAARREGAGARSPNASRRSSTS